MEVEKGLEMFVRGYEHLTPEERHRARRADAIYEAVFEEAGMRMDFFQRMPAWVEFIEGSIDEEELWERAASERENQRSFAREAV